ncbi:MAG: hypothetical protein R3349_12185 [Geminicoccaceae bacterium]|nr:hypothetical protein [Geminicoccaceae bacterium]
MGLTATIAVLVLALGLAGIANWRERRPREIGQPPLLPWIAVQMVAVVVAILMLAHLVSLLTGTPLKSRFGF